MKKSFCALVLLGGLSACAEFQAREASCACFDTSGAATGNCDFSPVAGRPAVFKLVADGPQMSVDPSTHAGIRDAICGA